MDATMTLNYGYQELRQVYQKLAMRSLLAATVFHLSVIGGYLMLDKMFPPETVTGGRNPRVNIYTLQPPSLIGAVTTPNVSLPSPLAAARQGTPIPVPDGTVNPESTIPDQTELSKNPGSGVEGTEGTDIGPYTPGSAVNPEEESAPPDFKAVEKQPAVIKMVMPAYPDLARRAGIEGTAFLRLWIGKDGKVKKAEVLKSDSDLFNQPAIDAAMRWVFTPAVMNSGPVSVWVAIPFRFRLNQFR